jgi:hypothetical protein
MKEHNPPRSLTILIVLVLDDQLPAQDRPKAMRPRALSLLSWVLHPPPSSCPLSQLALTVAKVRKHHRPCSIRHNKALSSKPILGHIFISAVDVFIRLVDHAFIAIPKSHQTLSFSSKQLRHAHPCGVASYRFTKQPQLFSDCLLFRLYDEMECIMVLRRLSTSRSDVVTISRPQHHLSFLLLLLPEILSWQWPM